MEIWLSYGKERLQLPVNPSSIGYDTSNNFEDVILASGDERTVIGGRDLKTFSIESFFPAKRANYMATTKHQAPKNYVILFEKWMIGKTPIQLQATGTNINHKVTIRNFSWKMVSGGDIEYTLELKEYKPISYSTVKVGGTGTTTRPPKPKPKAKVYHVVKKDENLWTISKKYYGTGTKGELIYQANKKVIGKNRNLIHPGMRLVMP